jgi:glycosyltransferase involved in cell wall biosynthesis
MLFDLLASLRRSEPQWELWLVTTEDGPLVARAAAEGVRTDIVPMPRAVERLGDAGAGGPAGGRVSRAELLLRTVRAAVSLPAFLMRMRRALRRIAPDVIQTNGFKMHILGLWARNGRTPLVWHVHDYVSARPMMSRLMRAHSGRAFAAITNSRSVGDDLSRVCGPSLTVVPVINAVDLEKFSPEGTRLDLDALSGLPPADAVRVGLVATMARWKGHEVFLRALARLRGRRNVRGYVIGGPVYRTEGSEASVEELRALAGELGIADRIGFTGFVNDAAAAMRTLDVVVHASVRPEPFGLVIVEALACGRPVIVSDAGGAGEIVRTVEGALSFPPGDDAALAAAIGQLVDDPGRRQELGRRGRESVRAKFDRQRLGPEVSAVLRRAVQ